VPLLILCFSIWVSDNSGDMVLVITNIDVLISHLMDVFGLDWAVQGGVSGYYVYVVKVISDQLGLHFFVSCCL
jgi:hypothetical protein